MTDQELAPFDPRDYGAAAAALIEIPRLCALGPGTPDEDRRASLQSLSADRLLAGRPVRDRDMAVCCLAGLWLRFDFLDESHTLSQSVHTTSGSFWHGIMHRREPDFSNAKYWFRQVGDHPVYRQLASDAAALASSSECDASAAFLAEQQDWNAFKFVDLCQAAPRVGASTVELCRQIQDREWRLLFDFCFHRA